MSMTINFSGAGITPAQATQIATTTGIDVNAILGGRSVTVSETQAQGLYAALTGGGAVPIDPPGVSTSFLGNLKVSLGVTTAVTNPPLAGGEDVRSGFQGLEDRTQTRPSLQHLIAMFGMLIMKMNQEMGHAELQTQIASLKGQAETIIKEGKVNANKSFVQGAMGIAAGALSIGMSVGGAVQASKADAKAKTALADADAKAKMSDEKKILGELEQKNKTELKEVQDLRAKAKAGDPAAKEKLKELENKYDEELTQKFTDEQISKKKELDQARDGGKIDEYKSQRAEEIKQELKTNSETKDIWGSKSDAELGIQADRRVNQEIKSLDGNVEKDAKGNYRLTDEGKAEVEMKALETQLRGGKIRLTKTESLFQETPAGSGKFELTPEAKSGLEATSKAQAKGLSDEARSQTYNTEYQKATVVSRTITELSMHMGKMLESSGSIAAGSMEIEAAKLRSDQKLQEMAATTAEKVGNSFNSTAATAKDLMNTLFADNMGAKNIARSI